MTGPPAEPAGPNITCPSARQMHLAPAVVSRGICRADGFPSREARRSLNEAR